MVYVYAFVNCVLIMVFECKICMLKKSTLLCVNVFSGMCRVCTFTVSRAACPCCIQFEEMGECGSDGGALMARRVYKKSKPLNCHRLS